MMKRKLLALSLTLVLALALCACGGSGGGTLAGGTWTQQEVELSDLQSYGAEDLKGPIPEDWTLPEDFTGESTVAPGADYTFTAKDKNYDFTFTGSTMGGADVEVIDNGDGTYTVKNVTGSIVITATKKGKQYPVTVTGSGKTDITVADFARYGEDFTFSQIGRASCRERV